MGHPAQPSGSRSDEDQLLAWLGKPRLCVLEPDSVPFLEHDGLDLIVGRLGQCIR